MTARAVHCSSVSRAHGPPRGRDDRKGRATNLKMLWGWVFFFLPFLPPLSFFFLCFSLRALL